MIHLAANLLYLRKKKKISQAKLATDINSTRTTITNYESGYSRPDYETLDKIVKYFDVSFDELLLADMSKGDSRPVAKLTTHSKGIPLIPIEAMAGIGNGSVSIMDEDIQERYVIPDFVDVDFMIRVKGSSMYPKYNSGDIVACKMLLERTFFQWGRVFVIHHREQGTMVKRLFPAEAETIECRSDNPKYPAFKINLSELTNIALVTGVVRLE